MDQSEIGFDVPGGKHADPLAVERHSLLRCSLRLITNPPQVPGESPVHDGFQREGELFSLGLALGSGHLQILGRRRIISRLRCLQKSEQGSAGRVPAQRVLGGFVGGVASALAQL